MLPARLLALVAILLTLAVACGGDDAGMPGTTAATPSPVATRVLEVSQPPATVTEAPTVQPATATVLAPVAQAVTATPAMGIVATATAVVSAPASQPVSPPTPAPPTVPPAAPTIPTPPAIPTVTATIFAASSVPVRQDIRPSRLEIPKLGIDASVGPSTLIPDDFPSPPGCPPKPPGNTTLTVPNQGIVSPVDALGGFENKVWIFGHSRYGGVPGILFTIQDLALGDELFIDGRDRGSGEQVQRRRFVVNGIYLTDTQSGETLITAATPSDIPDRPVVMLQTSVREDGAGKSWLLSQDKVLGKATNLIEGDIGDPCKYLLLFVFAEQA